MTDPRIAQRLERWLPDDPAVLAGSPPAWVLFVRETVTAAGPRTLEEVRVGLRRCDQFVTWARGRRLPLDAATLFTADHVTAYCGTLDGPERTRSAISSILRRLHPDLGFAGTTRRANRPPVADGDDDVVELADRRPVIDDAVAAEIARYAPARLPVERWEPIADVVRAAATHMAPGTTRRARNLCREIGYLAAWAVGEHRTLTPNVLLSGSTIETFLDVLTAGGVPPRSVASFASNLHAVRESYGLPLHVVRRQFPAAAEKDPYNRFELDRVFEQASRIPTKNRRRHALAALDLMLGVGAMPREVAEVRPDDVTVTSTDVLVTLTHPVRTVKVLPDYVAGIRRAVKGAVAAGDSHLIGGAANLREKRLLSLLYAPVWKVEVDTRRTRASWIVEVAATPGWYPHILDLLEATGLRTLARIDELLPHIAARRLELTTDITLPASPDAAAYDHAAGDELGDAVAS